MKCEVEINVEIPKGYKIKRIGLPREGERYIDPNAPFGIGRAPFDYGNLICIVIEPS